MKHEDIKILISAYLEDELDNEEKKKVEEHLAECPECRKECNELNQLEEVLNKMQLKKPSKEIWDVYWSSVYNRLERKLGWILLSIGLIILICAGVYPALKGFLSNPDTPLLLKIGLLSLVGGLLAYSILAFQIPHNESYILGSISRSVILFTIIGAISGIFITILWRSISDRLNRKKIPINNSPKSHK